MKVIRHDFFGCNQKTTYNLYPLFDLHLGPKACDESKLNNTVQRIKEDKSGLWVGGGDYADFIKMSDKRFDPRTLADWIGRDDLPYLAAVQGEKVVDTLSPIAEKCLGLAEGNHEDAVRRHYEQDVYRDLLTGIKKASGKPQDFNLGLDYTGFIDLHFWRSKKKEGGQRITIFIHHGWGGGRYAGGRALNLERALYYYDADLLLLGHTHDVDIKKRNIVNIGPGKIATKRKTAVRCGTYLDTVSYEDVPNYAEKSGYPPLPVAGVKIKLTPFQDNKIGVSFW